MERLADYIEERNALRGKILTAFIYPAVVGVVSIVICNLTIHLSPCHHCHH